MALASDEAYYNSEKQLKERKGKSIMYNNMNRQRLDFKFSDFQALQVENGWNKLFISIISVETGETIAKSGKASVRNGQCHWEDSLVNSIWISDDSPQVNESCLVKLLVAMGSARFGTLGEATINLASYIKPETSTASLPLKHCSHGTILQVKIQCLTHRRKFRKDANSHVEEVSVGYDDIDNISNVSDDTFSRTSRSSYCDQLDNTCHQVEPSSKKISPLTTCLDDDFDSLESSFSFWIGNFPQQGTASASSLKSKMNEKQDSTYPKIGPYPFSDTSRSNYSSSTSSTSSLGTQLQDKMEEFGQVSHARDATLPRSVGSSKDLLGAAEVTIELLHAEAKMWKQNARKSMTDAQKLQKELCNESKNRKDLEMKLSVSHEESDGLKEELESLTAMLKQNESKSKLKIEEMDNIIKEMKDEIKYHKGLNSYLESKLMKTQESNMELVSNHRKLEKMIEKQKLEIVDLSMTSLQSEDAESNSHVVEDSEEEDFNLSKEVSPKKMRKEFCQSDVNLFTNEYAIRCLHEGIELQEFWNLEREHQILLEKQISMDSTIQFLKKTLLEKDQEMQIARDFVGQTLEENEAKWRDRLLEKREQIIKFEKMLSDGVHAFGNEIEALTQKVQELEAEFCGEKLGESRKELVMSGSFSSTFNPHFTSETKVSNLKLQICKLEEELSMNDLTKEVSVAYLLTQCMDWKNYSTYLEGEPQKTCNDLEMKEFESNNHLAHISTKFETYSTFKIATVNDIWNLSGLKSAYDEAFSGLEAENAELSERVFDLEAILKVLKHLTDEKESTRLALENSETIVMNLQAEIRRLESQIEVQKVILKSKEESMQKKWLETQEECSFLKVANLELEATNENLIEESENLQTENGELGMQNLELHQLCTVLESKLGESEIAFSVMLNQVEDLEHKFTSMLGEIAVKEKTMNVKLDALLLESEKHNESEGNKIDNLHKEVEHLRDQISDIHEGNKKVASDTVLMVYDLCADKSMLEAEFQEVQEKVKLYETKLDSLQAEYEVKVHNCTEELAATKAKHETLMVNHKKVVVWLESVKSNEEKLKSSVRGLELELKASELERLQLTEEVSKLEAQLEKTEMLQDQLFALRRSLNEAELEYRRLEASHQMLSVEYEELKADKLSYARIISNIEKVTSELEDYKRDKVDLEEKILLLQWDLSTKEASWRNNAQLRYELARLNRTNDELHRKIDFLQEEYQKKLKCLEEELKQKEDVKQDQHEAKDSSGSTTTTFQDEFIELMFLQKEDNRPSILLHPYNDAHANDAHDILVNLRDHDSKNFQGMEPDFISKIKFLEK